MSVEQVALKAYISIREISPIIADLAWNNQDYMVYMRYKEQDYTIIDFEHRHIHDPAQYIQHAKRLFMEFAKHELKYGSDVVN